MNVDLDKLDIIQLLKGIGPGDYDDMIFCGRYGQAVGLEWDRAQGGSRGGALGSLSEAQGSEGSKMALKFWLGCLVFTLVGYVYWTWAWELVG